MSSLINKDDLERLDQLIRLKATGSPVELADYLNVTERTVYRMINKLKEIGCPIYYDKERNSYCYKCKGKIVIKFEEFKEEEIVLDKITGGNFVKSENILLTDIFCQYDDLYLQNNSGFSIKH